VGSVSEISDEAGESNTEEAVNRQMWRKVTEKQQVE
jgi:hypothetical protein